MAIQSTPVILSAARTPNGKFLGGLSSLTVAELGTVVFRAAMERAQLAPQDVDEVILGNVVGAGAGMALARNAALHAGLPETVPAYVVNKVCGSGMQAVVLAAQSIKAGDNAVVLAGGAESMSNAPYLLRRARTGYTYGNGQLEDSLLTDGLLCCFEKCPMGTAAEHIARRFSITRQAADRYAFESHRRAVAAMAAGKFKKEIVPVSIPHKSGAPTVVDRDEGPRADTTLEKLAALKPAFEATGQVTAGNSSSLNDGAAALVVASEQWASDRNKRPLARILAYATSGVAPKEIFHAPALAIPMAVKRAGLELKDIDLFEINEAFAAQMVANVQVLDLDLRKVNVHGGGIALGHPIGASGARVLVTLLHAMADRGAHRGCAALCLGGGNGVAMVVERV
ncbi:MAG TPA: acetyl-CoA C-acetyltransferase [Planctomycetota bacterium]|jgi:acetyl-CoA C-acetyltransferase